MNLEKALEIHKYYGLDIVELVGGPLDGLLAISLRKCDAYDGEVYNISYRKSPQHYEFYCSDYVGNWNDPQVMKMLKDSWKRH